MRPYITAMLALCSATTSAAVIQERQLGGIIGGVLGGGGGATTTSSARASSTTLATVPLSVSVSVSVSVSIRTTNLASATIGLSAAPIYTSNPAVSLTVAVCVPGATPLLDVGALQTTLGSITTNLNKAANPVVASNPLLGLLGPLVPTVLGATQLLADIATTNALVSVTGVGLLASVTASSGCLSVDTQLNICQLLEQLLRAEEVLLTKITNTCATTRSLGTLCSSLSLGLVLSQLVLLQMTIDQFIGAIVSLGVLPTCAQNMAARQADIKQTVAGTIITLNNLPNVITTNVGGQVVSLLGFAGISDPAFQALAGYPNKKRRGGRPATQDKLTLE